MQRLTWKCSVPKVERGGIGGGGGGGGGDWNAVGGNAQYLSGKAFTGQLSYDCVRLGARVADLAISVSREFDADPGSATTAPASTNLPLTVHMYAEVDKAIAVAPDNTYRIVYA